MKGLQHQISTNLHIRNHSKSLGRRRALAISRFFLSLLDLLNKPCPPEASLRTFRLQEKSNTPFRSVGELWCLCNRLESLQFQFPTPGFQALEQDAELVVEDG